MPGEPPSDFKPGFNLQRFEGIVSRECLDVLESLLNEDPSQRLSASELLASPWLSQVYGPDQDYEEITQEMNTRRDYILEQMNPKEVHPAPHQEPNQCIFNKDVYHQNIDSHNPYVC